MSRYSAAICKRGHWVDPILELHIEPPAKFCKDCGAPVITACAECGARLLGGYEGVVSFDTEPPDPFCIECGSPHRWATREQRLEQLATLIEFEDLDDATMLVVEEQIALLARPVDQTSDEVAAQAVSRLRSVAPHALDVMKPVLVSFLSKASIAAAGL